MPKSSTLKNLIKSEPIKIKMETLLNSTQALQKILMLKLPVVVSFKVGKTIKAIDVELTAYSDSKNKRIKELGEKVKGENGELTENYKVTEENTPQWLKENKELLDREVNLDIYKLSLSDLGDEKLEPFVFSQLDWLITE